MSRPPSQIRYGNRLIQQKQQAQTLQKHYQSLRKARPMTGNTVQHNAVMINNKKRQMVQQTRFTEIERENRLLFQKITTIMTKGTISQSVGVRERSNTQINKTLNGGYRKKQMLKIEYENARMLKRLKQKKSLYGVAGFQRDWQKKKRVIQNMSLYPFILNDNAGALIKRQKINDEFLMRHHSTFEAQSDLQPRQIRRIRKIDGCMFLITIKFEGDKLFIIGDIKEEQNIKIIELDKKEAESFLIDECNGNVENIFSLLRFDRGSGDLYLVGKDVGQIERVKHLQSQQRKTHSQHDSRGRKTLQQRSRKQHYPPRPMSKQLARRNNYTLDTNNEQYIDLGLVNSKLDKVKVNSNLNLLEQQMNLSIKRKLSTKIKQNNVVKQQANVQRNDDNLIEKQKQHQWVKVQKEQEQQQEQPQQHFQEQEQNLIENSFDKQNDNDYQGAEQYIN